MENEIWKDVKGYEGYYQVSNMGRVKSMRVLKTPKNGAICRKNAFLSTKTTHDKRYIIVALCRDGEIKPTPVHRLVAETFIPNPNNLPFVNHKDEDPTNNHVDNLEWCTCAYNLAYNNGYARRAETRRKSYKRVLQIDDNGRVVQEWESAIAAARGMGCALASISRAINGHRKRVRGYKFVWKDEWLTANGYKLNEQ